MGVGGFRNNVRADDVKGVAIVTDKAEEGIGLLSGKALVFLDGGQISQIL